MTKVMTRTGWVYITIVLDWYSKKVVGHHIGPQSKSKHWLEALDNAINTQFPFGVRGQNLHLMSDNGSQPTATSYMQTCANLGIQQAFTAYNNPKGNADTERFMRTMKEECLWLQEWERRISPQNNTGTMAQTLQPRISSLHAGLHSPCEIRRKLLRHSLKICLIFGEHYSY